MLLWRCCEAQSSTEFSNQDWYIALTTPPKKSWRAVPV